MTVRAILVLACMAAACHRVETVGADHLLVSATVGTDTFSLSRDTGPVLVTIVARNPESRAIDVDTHGGMRIPLEPYVALISDSAAASQGLSFGLRMMHYDRRVFMEGYRAGAWSVRFGPGEARSIVDTLRRSRLASDSIVPGQYLLIGSYVSQEAPPVRLIVTR